MDGDKQTLRAEAEFIALAYFNRGEEEDQPETRYIRTRHQIERLGGLIEYFEQRIRLAIGNIGVENIGIDPDEAVEQLQASYNRELRKKRVAPNLAGGRKVAEERGGKSIDDSLRDPLTERVEYIAQEIAKNNRKYAAEFAYYDIASTLNGQKRYFDERIREEVDRLGRNGSKVVEYLKERYEFLKQTKEIVEAEKQRLADPQSRIKPDKIDRAYIAIVAKTNGDRALFDRVLDLEVKRAEKDVPRLSKLVKRLRDEARIYFGLARTMGERLIVI
jgi:hypothetical protein